MRTAFTGLVAAGLLAACAGGGDSGKGRVAMVLNLRSAERAGFHVDEVGVRFENDDGVIEEQLEVSGEEAAGEFDLDPGRWRVDVELLQEGERVGTGHASAVVIEGKLTDVHVAIDLATGGVSLHVSWTDEPEIIADLSLRPVKVDVSGVGEFRVHGMSRLGWDVEVIETPTQGGRSHKDPGLVTIPEVAMVELASTEGEADALAAWIAEPDARSVLVHLQGLGGETARIRLRGAVPVGGDPRIQPLGQQFSVAGLLLGDMTFIELDEYDFPTDYPLCAAPGQKVEIEGVVNDLCYPTDALHPPDPGTSDSLHLPAVRFGEQIYDHANAYRLEIQEYGCAGCVSQSRRALSVIDLDDEARELGRVNVFETWTSSFTFFDPEVSYGHGYLFSETLQSDFVEQG